MHHITHACIEQCTGDQLRNVQAQPSGEHQNALRQANEKRSAGDVLNCRLKGACPFARVAMKEKREVLEAQLTQAQAEGIAQVAVVKSQLETEQQRSLSSQPQTNRKDHRDSSIS